MRSDRTLALGAAVIAALSFAPAAAEEPKEIFTWGADARLREEVVTNVGLDDNVTNADRAFQRYRLRLWGKLAPTDDFEANARLMWEGRHYNEPDEDTWPVPGFETWYSGAVLFDALNLNFKRIGGSPLSLKVGRQDIIFGNGWLILDGTPLDGSRTIYFDAARATFAAEDIGTTFDLIYVNNNADTDRFPQQLNDAIEDQIEQDEQGLILYARNKSLVKDWDLDGYFIYKDNDAQVYPDRCYGPPYDRCYPTLRINNGAPFNSPSDDGQVYTLGVRADGKLSPNWGVRAEAAGQWGDRSGTDSRGSELPSEDIGAFGFNGRLTYHFNDDLANRLHLDFEFLSGDDPSTSKSEYFDPLWGRWPQWSELMIYQWPLDQRVGEATNLKRLNFGWAAKVHPTTEVTLDYHALWADEESTRLPAQLVNISQDGSFRGHLFTGWVRTKLNKNVSGHLVAEYFDPGSFYADGSPKGKTYRQDDSIFFRAELNLTW